MLSLPKLFVHANGLSDVLFDNFGGPKVGRAHVASCFAQRATLAQEVPALVELDLDRGEAPALGIVERALLEQTMLFRDEVLDVREDGYVLWRVVHVGAFRCAAELDQYDTLVA